MKREENSRVTGCGSREGKVFAWIKHAPGSSPGSQNIKVMLNSLTALSEFCKKYMGKDLENYIDLNMSNQ